MSLRLHAGSDLATCSC